MSSCLARPAPRWLSSSSSRRSVQAILELLNGAESRRISAEEALSGHTCALSEQTVADVLLKTRDGDFGLAFFRWAATQAGFEHSTYTCNCLLRVLIKQKRHDDAHRLFNEDPLLVRCSPSSFTYNMLISGYCAAAAAGGMAKAFRLLDEMKERSLGPDKVTHGIILRGLCSSGKITEALAYFMAVPETSEVDVVMYNTLIDGLCKSGRIEEAHQLVEEMQELGWKPTVVTYTSLLHGLCMLGKIDEGRKLFEEMKSKGCKPTVVTTNALLDGLSKAGKVEEALGVLRGLSGNSVNVITFSIVIDGLCRSGRVDKALELVEQMKTKGCSPNVVTYSSIISGFCKVGKVDEALTFLQQLLEQKQVVPDVIMFGTLINGLCKSGKVSRAQQLLEEMTRLGCSPNAYIYSTLLDGLLKARKLADACALFQQMHERGCSPTVVTYTSIIHGLFRTFRPEEALSCLKSMTVAPNVVTFGAIINGLCKAGRMPEARRFLHFMTQLGCKPNTHVYNAYLDGLCKQNQLGDEARCIFQQIEQPTTITFNILIDAFCKHHAAADAVQLFIAMADRNCAPTAVTYNALAEGLLKLDEAGVSSALGAIKEAVKLEYAFEVITRVANRAALSPATVISLMKGLSRSGKRKLAKVLFPADGGLAEKTNAASSG